MTGAVRRRQAGRERPGHVGRERQRRTLRSANWPARYGSRRKKAPPPWLPTVAQALASTVSQAAELHLCSNPPQPYKHVVILTAQKPQTGTSEHELKERACHIALSALLRGWAGGDPHELRLLARRSRPGVRSTRPGPYVGSTLGGIPTCSVWQLPPCVGAGLPRRPRWRPR